MLKETFFEKITTAYDEHSALLKAIMHESVEPGLITEVETASENFGNKLNQFADELDRPQELIDALEAITFDEDQFSSLVKAISSHDDYDEGVLINEVDESTLADHLASKGYICVRLKTMDQVQKLRDFIESEIYPHINEQNEFLHF